ncbi:MAG: ATP-binding cassette domain-containing protein [Chloroflexota bacterium]
MPANNTITVENVTKSFGDLHALKGVSFHAPAGEVLGLLGPNGAGKTTLVRIMTTLLMPDSGSVTVAGIDVLNDRQAARAAIGLAGQYPAVDEVLTGRENLMMVGQLYHMSRKQARARADELLEQFTLTDAGGRPVKTYSGGMRRRLDLAASIVAKPPVLFLDEPTTGLDPRTRIDMWNAIRALVSDGTTLLLTTQYLEEADELANEIIVMDQGAVIATGTASELKGELASDYLVLSVADKDQTNAAMAALRGIGTDEPTRDNGHITIPVVDGGQAIVEAVRVLDGQGIRIADLRLREPSLNDVFLAITGKEIEDEAAPTPA